MTFDLDAVFKQYDLQAAEIAILLFPGNLHPRKALNRALKGAYVLDANQIARLAEFIGVDVNALYSPNWMTKPSKGHVLNFQNGEYFAELNTVNLTTRIFHKNTLFHTLLLSPESITLREYFLTLNKITHE